MEYPPQKLVLATISMCSTSDINKNIETAFCLVKKAKDLGANWILLPEVFAFFGSHKEFYKISEKQGEKLFNQLSQLAKELGVYFFAGTVHERPTPSEREIFQTERVYNTLYVFKPDGSLAAKYRKTHLFNLIGDKGEIIFSEKNGFLAGDRIISAQIADFNVGLAICYDLRFPEFFIKLSQPRAPDIIVIPSAFTAQTGKAHWELLLRAKAVEYQCYVFAANQCGEHGGGRASSGHSMIIDPWGKVLADTGEGEGIGIAHISREKIAKVRAKLPALANKRPEIY